MGNSLVQKSEDSLYSVTDTMYNSRITNVQIDVEFYNATDSSQSTLTIGNVETDYDELYSYFCKVQYNNPEQGMIADLKASESESFNIYGKLIYEMPIRICISSQYGNVGFNSDIISLKNLSNRNFQCSFTGHKYS